MPPPPNSEASPSININETLRRMRSFNPEPPPRPRHWERYEQVIDTNGNQGAITPFLHDEIGDPSANAYPRSAWRVFLSRWGIEDPGPLFILFAYYSGGLFSGLLTRYLPKFWLSPNRYKMYTSIMTHVGIAMFMVSGGTVILNDLQVTLASHLHSVVAPKLRKWGCILQSLRFQSEPADEEFEDNGENSLEATCRCNHLCGNCRTVLRSSGLIYGTGWGLTRADETHKLYGSVAAIAEGISQQCHFCTLVSVMLVGDRDLKEKELAIDEPVFLKITGSHNGRFNALPELEIIAPKYFERTTPRLWDAVDWKFYVNREVLDYTDLPPLVLIPFRPTTSHCSTGSTEHRKLMLKWYDECSSMHEECRQISTPFVPTRLIAISDDPEPRLSLYLSSPNDTNIQYCALSHCWGGADVTRLTTENLPSFQKSVPLSSLPQTFKDAVTITRSLGLRFLWLDSLCIIQDSHLDWTRESATMGDVYEAAHVTIAAAGGENSNMGCFSTYNPLRYVAARIAGDENDGLAVYPANGNITRRADSRLIGTMQALNWRCWTFQERLFSRRIIHFGEIGMKWTCRCAWSNEYIVAMFPNATKDETRAWRELVGLARREETATMRQPRHSFPMFKDDELPPDHRELSAEAQFHRNWTELVEEYGRRHLTQPGDRLMALSGLAQRIQRNTGATYLAGLWHPALHLHLMWTVNSIPVPPRPPAYRAPSWSWASVGSGWIRSEALMRPHETFASLIELAAHDIQCHPTDASKTGEVSSASLFLEASVKPFDVRFIEPLSFYGEVQPNSWSMSDGGERLGTCQGDVPEAFEGLHTIYLMPVIAGRVDVTKYSNVAEGRLRPTLHGLLLKRCARKEPRGASLPDAGEFYYERFGHFRFIGTRPEADCMTWFDDVERQIVELQ